MDEILALTMQSMHADMDQLAQVGMNMTNSTTPGYKREVSMMRPFGSLIDTALAAPPAAATVTATVTDLATAGLRHTGQSLDIALTGNAFFEVATPQGPAYTRRGDLHVDERGRLVTSTGQAMQSLGGDIVLNGGDVAIDSAGRVTETTPSGTRQLGQLKLMRYPEHAQPVRLADGLLASASDMTPAAEGDSQVRQGYLENSNVSSAHEMMQLMQTMRHFEAMQRTTQGYDEMVSSAIRKLGDV